MSLSFILEALGIEQFKDRRGQYHWRDQKSGRFTKAPVLWRYSYGLKWLQRSETLAYPIVDHGKYYGALIQAWSYDRQSLESERIRLRDELWELLRDYLRYSPEEWWFPIDDGEGFQQVDLKENKKYEGRWIARIESASGRTVKRDEGDL